MELTKKLLKEINGILSLNAPTDGAFKISLGAPCIDSRKVRAGDTFFGISGEGRDGCDYFEDAVVKGAKVVILNNSHRESFEKSDVAAKTGAIAVFVNNTKTALKQIGFFNRLAHSIPFVAVTGSNGKTTTKELIAAILATKYKVFKTDGNFNNDLGLPMELMKLDDTHEIGVVELGMSALHEIENLASLVLPRVGVITCVGPSHIEFLKTLKNIAKAKAELISKVDTQGTVILNYDNTYTRKMASLYSGKVTGYAIDNKSARIRAERVELNERGFYNFSCSIAANGKKYEPFSVYLPLAGKHNVLNCLAAIAVGLEFDVNIKKLCSAINNFDGVKKRMELIEIAGGIRVLNDCYNANPLSMKSAIETISEIPGASRRIAIIGDMLELGAWSVRSHMEIGRLAKKSGIDLLVTVGERAEHIREAAIEAGMDEKNAIHFKDSDETAGRINGLIKNGDLILIKGSRRMKLENVLNAIQGERE